MKKILPILVAAIGFLRVTAMATPDVTGVSYTGSLVAGTTLTLACVSCGANGPKQVLFDSFEGGVAGSSISLSANAADYGGTYNDLGSEGPVYSTTEKFTGSQAMFSDMSSGAGGNKYAEVNLSSTTRLFYCHNWKITGNWPGYSNGSGINVKDPWIMFGNSTTDTDLYPGFNTNDAGEPPEQWLFDGNDSSFTKFSNFNTSTTSAPSGSPDGWHQACWWVMGNGTGEMRFYNTTATGTIKLAYTTSTLAIPFFSDSGNQHTYWNLAHIMGFGRAPEADSGFYHDDVYIATGNVTGTGGEAAHVWLMDQPTINASSKWAVLKPVSWADTSVQVMLPTHTFSSGIAYLITCDANFVCEEPGFQVTLGAINPSGSTLGITGLTLKGITIGN